MSENSENFSFNNIEVDENDQSSIKNLLSNRVLNYKTPRKPCCTKPSYFKCESNWENNDELDCFWEKCTKDGSFTLKNLDEFISEFSKNNKTDGLLREKLIELFESNDKNNSGFLIYEQFTKFYLAVKESLKI